MTRKKIGITLRVVNNASYPETRDAISHDWTYFCNKLDLYPVLIPNTVKDLGKFLVDMNLDGFILSGGDNIGDNTERDVTENTIIEFAKKK